MKNENIHLQGNNAKDKFNSDTTLSSKDIDALLNKEYHLRSGYGGRHHRGNHRTHTRVRNHQADNWAQIYRDIESRIGRGY